MRRRRSWRLQGSGIRQPNKGEVCPVIRWHDEESGSERKGKSGFGAEETESRS